MLQEIKLVILQNGQLLEAITESTPTNPSQLLNSLQNVQKRTNEILTKMVDSSNKIPGQKEEDVYEENDSESEGDDDVRTKKRKL